MELHVAETGTGSLVVVFIHGFPEIWYSWRHQMITVANGGYRAIAPDLRGYGLSQHHPDLEKASSFNNFVENTIAILDYFQIEKGTAQRVHHKKSNSPSSSAANYSRQDYFQKFPGIEDYITSGKVKEYMSYQEIKSLPKGTRFVQEQFPDQVNQLIISFPRETYLIKLIKLKSSPHHYNFIIV